MSNVWDVTDRVPPQLFPEYVQTVANDTPVIVNEAVQWWELLELDSPEWDYQRGVDELDQ